MPHTIALEGEPRTIVGKQVKQLRREGLVPGNIYGPDMPSQPIQVQIKKLEQALRHATASTLVELTVDGTKHQVLVREVQRELLRQTPIHVEFFAANMENKIRAAVAIVLRGEAPATKMADAILIHPVTTVTLEGRPIDLPEALEVDVSGLTEIDQAIHAGELVLPPDVVLMDPPETMLVKIQQTRAEPEAEAAEEAAEEAAAEGAPAEGTAEGEAKTEQS